MELLAEFAAAYSPNYKHGTPCRGSALEMSKLQEDSIRLMPDGVLRLIQARQIDEFTFSPRDRRQRATNGI